MKKLMFLAAIAMVLTVFNACQKEEVITTKELPSEVSTKYVPEFGKFKEEIIVYDATGENSLFIALHSNYKESIDKYLKTYKFELVPQSIENNTSLKSAGVSNMPLKKVDFEVSKEVLDQKVTIEILAENLKQGAGIQLLSITRRKPEGNNILKSGNFIFGEYGFVTTSGDFLGIVHRGYGWDGNEYDLWVSLEYKLHWYSSWVSSASGFIYGTGERYYGYLDFKNISHNKLGIGFYYDARQTWDNVLIAYNKYEFRGQTCSVGSYDTANCYVGTAPTGTTAWYGSGHFYYTPLNGNQCPLPGSSFDTVNCYVGDYPANCEPFILGNSWYVKPDQILNN